VYEITVVVFFSPYQNVIQQRMHKVRAFLPYCMQFIWWSGGQRVTVWVWEIEVMNARGSGLQFACTCPHTGIVGKQSVSSRLVFSTTRATFLI
jgi:hypothetical protein